eukprot:scaffold22602_cov154-Cylindrotheca_fusiformis.AAC.4
MLEIGLTPDPPLSKGGSFQVARGCSVTVLTNRSVSKKNVMTCTIPSRTSQQYIEYSHPTFGASFSCFDRDVWKVSNKWLQQRGEARNSSKHQLQRIDIPSCLRRKPNRK